MKLIRVPEVLAALLTAIVLATGCAEDEKPASPVNVAPTACFTVFPESGPADTVFHFDASCSSDKKEPISDLEVRWDWDSDGTWDYPAGGYTTTKAAEHQYSSTGMKTITLEIRDTGGLTDSTTGQVLVAGPAPTPPEMVLVPAGTFTMGDGDVYCGQDERMVTLTRPFYIGRYEVTVREYCEALQWAYDRGYLRVASFWVLDNLDASNAILVNLNECRHEATFSSGTFTIEPGTADRPMVAVSWYGAARYCDWLNMGEGLPRAYEHSGDWSCNGGDPYGAQGYRLPTDAEWEYAAQFNDGRIYPWGNEEPGCSRANYGTWQECCMGWTTPVGSYPPAPESLGLYDMAGNVWEWCNDWFSCDLGTTTQTDPTGPESGSYRVLHGGSWAHWYFANESLRCASRVEGPAAGHATSQGLRCARSQLDTGE